MKQFWKCDFCSEFNTDSEAIKQHETVCQFNPKLKRCGSCSNQAMDYDIFICDAGADWSMMEAVEEGVIICDKWKEG